MKDYFMKLFLDYLNKIKLQILLMLFPTILTGMIFLLYQLPLEPILYIAVLWILTGLGTCAFGFHNYQKNIHNLQIISAAPDINLSRMDAPSNEADALQQEIMHSPYEKRTPHSGDTSGTCRKSSLQRCHYDKALGK